MEPAFQRGDILFLNNWVRSARLHARCDLGRSIVGVPSWHTNLCAGCCPCFAALADLKVSPEYPYRVGDIVVFKLAGRDIPIVHRVLKVHEKDDGDVDLLTKGDNNKVDDRGLYNTGQKWLNKEHVIGRARGYLPYVGMVTIIMNDYPMFKCASNVCPVCARARAYVPVCLHACVPACLRACVPACDSSRVDMLDLCLQMGS
jgi:signal peptidase I